MPLLTGPCLGDPDLVHFFFRDSLAGGPLYYECTQTDSERPQWRRMFGG